MKWKSGLTAEPGKFGNVKFISRLLKNYFSRNIFR